jgi:hypothetical protein
MLFEWPDLYDYNSDSKGVGFYSVMSYTSGGNPVPPDPYLRSIWCGWGKVSKLNDLPNQTQVTAKAGSLEVFKFEGPNPREYFLIENISNKGRWANMPDQGLIIWHIDEGGSNDWQNMTYVKHYMVSVEQADGKFDLEMNMNYGDLNDLFGGPQFTTFTDITIPNSKWWNGQSSGLNITNISTVGDVMTFTINNSNNTVSTPTSTPTLTIPTPTPITSTSTPTQTPTVSLPNTPTPTSQEIIVGDINGDKVVNSLDLAYMRLYLLGMTSNLPSESSQKAFDVNGDSLINSLDYGYLRMYLLGYIDKFPV